MGLMPLHGVHATLRRYIKPLERQLHAYSPWDDLALKHHVTCNIGDAIDRGVLKSEGTSEGDRATQKVVSYCILMTLGPRCPSLEGPHASY